MIFYLNLTVLILFLSFSLKQSPRFVNFRFYSIFIKKEFLTNIIVNVNEIYHASYNTSIYFEGVLSIIVYINNYQV